MRELTAEELELIAGGMSGGSDGGDPWWHEAFDWMSEGLDWIGNAFGGWADGYLDLWADFTASFSPYGDEVNCWDDFTDYQIEYDGSQGEYYNNFNDWYENTDPSTCDIDSDPNNLP